MAANECPPTRTGWVAAEVAPAEEVAFVTGAVWAADVSPNPAAPTVPAATAGFALAAASNVSSAASSSLETINFFFIEITWVNG